MFDTDLVIQVTDWLGLQILAVEPTRPYRIFIIARKLHSGQSATTGYRPTTSVSFSRKRGSRDNLKRVTRCGLS